MPVKITVITICKNCEATIEKTIQSVVVQDYPNVEYIIIDGGSSDATLSIIKKYSDKIAKLVSEPDRGISDAFNKGLSLATGDLVAFLNADDSYRNATILSTVANSFVDVNTVLCGSILLTGLPGGTSRVIKSEPGKLKYGMYVKHPATFVPRVLFNLHGNFCERYKIAMDYDLCLRLMLNGARFRVSSQVLTVMTAGGISGDPIRAMREELLVKKYYGIQGFANWIYYFFNFVYAEIVKIFGAKR